MRNGVGGGHRDGGGGNGRRRFEKPVAGKLKEMGDASGVNGKTPGHGIKDVSKKY